MIRSMTGYGQALGELPDTRIRVEARTVNHRFADVRVRLPTELSAQQAALRRTVLKRVKRGRADVTIALEGAGGSDPRPALNRALLDEVVAALAVLRAEHGIDGASEPASLLAVPGMFRPRTPGADWGDEEQAALERALGAALDALDAERLREGRHLADELARRIAAMRSIVAPLGERAAAMPDTLRQRIEERLAALARDTPLEPARVAQEAAILAERADVTEELVRLDGHLDQVAALIADDGPAAKGPVGKRLDFLLQELHRETNTINSKSTDLELSRHALDLKAEVEKMREQVQNVE